VDKNLKRVQTWESGKRVGGIMKEDSKAKDFCNWKAYNSKNKVTVGGLRGKGKKKGGGGETENIVLPEEAGWRRITERV